MKDEDIKNLVGWLQAIFKEVQTARGSAQELRPKVDLLPEIRDLVKRDEKTDQISDQKIEDTRNRLENQLRKMEDVLNDVRSEVRDLKSKVERLK